jgi:D-alanyl-D-alanine carboxypeptidase
MFRYPDVETPPHYEGKDLPFDGEFGVKFVKYPMTWHNSNRLLTVPGFTGVKTGITPSAGSCLSVWYENEGCKLITVVLGSRNIEYRWRDARRLTLWAAATVKY